MGEPSGSCDLRLVPAGGDEAFDVVAGLRGVAAAALSAVVIEAEAAHVLVVLAGALRALAAALVAAAARLVGFGCRAHGFSFRRFTGLLA
ncbi:hypothetical protein GCM10010317_077740 [Streptomyces mirabilis]|nr:hypothetical protein GCM10010317_077740 [Streptomyces mirabilis]